MATPTNISITRSGAYCLTSMLFSTEPYRIDPTLVAAYRDAYSRSGFETIIDANAKTVMSRSVAISLSTALVSNSEKAAATKVPQSLSNDFT
mmetsp:Transcript_18038/g.41449  ORF Transcript_18038/g.41449 Transcript_18038/m.41449 type:complete len:92 (+) Transcript_18038:1-276(+)